MGRKDTGKLRDSDYHALWIIHRRGYSFRWLAERVWKRYGYASPGACLSSIKNGFRVRGFTSVTKSEAASAWHRRRKLDKKEG